MSKGARMAAELLEWLDGAGRASAGHAMLLAGDEKFVAAAILRSALLVVEAKDGEGE